MTGSEGTLWVGAADGGGLLVRLNVLCERVRGFEGLVTEGTLVRLHGHVTVAYVS